MRPHIVFIDDNTTERARTMRDEDYIYELAFDPEDVDVCDFVNMTERIHGETCPEIVSDDNNAAAEHARMKYDMFSEVTT